MTSRKESLNKIYLRRANIQDLHLLEAWDKQAHVINADPNDDWNWRYELNRNPAWREQLIAMHVNTPFGFVQIIDPHLEESHYWGDIDPNYRAIDIWIGPPEYLNQGYGTQIMKMVIEKCFTIQEVKAILVDPLISNTDAHRFYENLGFEYQETRHFNEDECYIYRLTRLK